MESQKICVANLKSLSTKMLKLSSVDFVACIDTSTN